MRGKVFFIFTRLGVRRFLQGERLKAGVDVVDCFRWK